MSETIQLSDLQLALMRILWDRKEANSLEVHSELLAHERELAPTTVATMLSRLEKKGLLTHRVEGRQFIYRPLLSEHEVRRSMLARLTDYFFKGDVSALVSHLVDGSGDDVARAREILAQRADEEEHDDD
jgi:BlaI family penicillinase repressor